MENSQKQRNKARKNRLMRNRKKLQGTSERPRLSVIKSNKHLYAQLIDDVNGKTLKGVGTLTAGFKALALNGDGSESSKMKASKHLGAEIAGAAKALGIERVIFDRGSRQYHGIIKALADSAREAGLDF